MAFWGAKIIFWGALKPRTQPSLRDGSSETVVFNFLKFQVIKHDAFNL